MAVKTEIKYLDPAVVSKLKNIEIKARMIVEGFITGLHKSPYHGFSVEFAEHRPYNPGEPLRNIDWKVYGKTDRLYSKRFEEETNLRCHVVMDVSDSMRYPEQGISKLEYGAYLAAALQYLMVLQKDAAGLTLFDSEVRFSAPPKARVSWLLPLFKKLEDGLQEKIKTLIGPMFTGPESQSAKIKLTKMVDSNIIGGIPLCFPQFGQPDKR